MKSELADIKRFSKSFGMSKLDAARIMMVLRLGGRTLMRFSFLGGLKSTIEVAHRKDLRALEATFVDQEYVLSRKIKPHVVFDLGAYIGDTALFFHREYPEAQIFAFEPHPELFEALTRNTRRIDRITCRPWAIAGTTGMRDLSFGGSRLGASLKVRPGHPYRKSVEAVTLQDAMDRLGINRVDLLKFDIEGAEDEVFREPFSDFVDNAVGEVHEDLIESSEDFIGRFRSAYRVKTRRIEDKRVMIEALSD